MCEFTTTEIGMLYAAVGHRSRQIRKDKFLMEALEALRDKLLVELQNRGGRPMTTITIVPETLTDGSIAYDVSINEHLFHAVTRRDAYQLADKLAEAIEAHTNDKVNVRAS